MRQEELVDGVFVENSDADCVLELSAPVFPFLNSEFSELVVSSVHQLLHLFASVVPVAGLVLPDGECSLLLGLDAPSDEEPRLINRTGFMLVPCHLIVLILSPSVENASLDLVALDHVCDVNILLPESQRLESILIPLM